MLRHSLVIHLSCLESGIRRYNTLHASPTDVCRHLRCIQRGKCATARKPDSMARAGSPEGYGAMPQYAPAHPGVATPASSAVDTGFDVGQGMSTRSTPAEVLALFQIFNKCYNAGHHATVSATHPCVVQLCHCSVGLLRVCTQR